MTSIAQFAEAYTRRYGLAIVPLPPKTKRPLKKNWGIDVITDPVAAREYFEQHPDWNIGAALGPSRLCSFDIDNLEATRLIFDEFGFNLDELIENNPTVSGNPAKCRVMFRVPDGVTLPYHSLTWPNKDGGKGRFTVWEIRAADEQQRQDVLPPSIHPDTGKPYVWLTKPNGHFPEPPSFLINMWENWDKLKPQFQAVCPWVVKQAPTVKKPPAQVRDGASVIQQFVDAHDIETTLERYGYKRQGRRWLSPHSGTGLPGVNIFEDGRSCWIHHASDPLCSDESGQPVNVFDLFCCYEHNGDVSKAVRAAADILGIKPQRQAPPANVVNIETREVVDVATIPTVEMDSNGYAPEYSDADLSIRFVTGMQGNTLWCETWGKWLIWEGNRWVRDETLIVQDKIRASCMATSNELLMTPDSGGESKRIRQANQLSSYRTISAVERLSRSDRRVATHPDEWDFDAWLLNTPGGVVDLRDGSIRPHQRTDKITKTTSVAPGGDCPTWRRFLHDATAGDTDLQDFLQRMCGYVLTGTVREHALFFVYGTGGNGKGTFLNTITSIMGDYQRVSGAETFTESHGDRHETELARLQGARLVTAQETEEGKRWAESRIKALTGGDPITARYMRQDYFTFLPQFKLVIAGNHKPSFRAVDEAIRRRLHLIPFTVSIPAEQRDPFLPEKLKAEASGILSWMIDGCLQWQKHGLMPPAIVKDSTDLYLEEEDSITQWLEECCIKSTTGFASSAELYNSWKSWAQRNGEFEGTKKRLSHRLESLGFSGGRQKQTRGFFGISLLPGSGW